MKIRKAVIPAAGWGTRFLPATKAVPKEMMPVVDRPVIQRVVEEAVAAGLQQVIIVTASGKRAIEDHFDRTRELETLLENKGKSQLLAELQRIAHLADITYVRQMEQLGLGHAVLTARHAVGEEPFAVLLPDDLIDGPLPAIAQLLEVFEEYRSSVVGVQPVAPEEIAGYGIISPRSLTRRVYEILDLVEKPSPDQAPSNLAIVGRYVLTPEIFPALESTRAGSGGEIQLTDGLRQLGRKQKLFACEIRGRRFDSGNPLGLLKASIDLALRDPALGSDLRDYLLATLGLGAEEPAFPPAPRPWETNADEPFFENQF